MKFEITATVNAGDFEFLKFKAGEGNSFEECAKVIKKHLDETGLKMGRNLITYFKEAFDED